MAVMVVLVYAAVAAFELWLWDERPWKKVVLYLVLFTGAATLAALIMVDNELAVPEPVGYLKGLVKKLWQGGGGP